MPALEAGSSHTNWALIFDASRRDLPPSDAALETLVRRYWPAVYAYIRRSGRDVHEAADLTQGFVCDVVLGRSLFAHADPKRGRFRALLMNALANYLKDCHRHETSTMRAPALKPLHLDHAEASVKHTANASSPEHAFCAQWNVLLVRDVLERVRESCIKSGLEAHWEVFEARIVRPMLFNEPRVPYSRLIKRLELADSAQASTMIIAVKRRFVQALVQEVAATVGDPMQVEDELRDLPRDLERYS